MVVIESTLAKIDSFSHNSGRPRVPSTATLIEENDVQPFEQPINERTSWESFLANLEESPINLSEEFAKKVRRLWQKLESAVGAPLRPPYSGPGGENGFVFHWNTEESTIDIDVNEKGEFEWFFISKDMDEPIGSEDDDFVLEPPERLVRLLYVHCAKK